MTLNQDVVGAKGCCTYSGVIQIKYYDVFGDINTFWNISVYELATWVAYK